MTTREIILSLLVIVLGGAVAWLFFFKDASTPEPQTQIPVSITSFDECARLYPVQESYPPRCSTPDGQSFTQDIGNELEKRDLVRIAGPRPNTVISSPLAITGEARGNWYFEASFPLELRDENNQVIARGFAQAEGEWMTTEFVPFKGTLTFVKPAAGSKGTLILHKDNPSGLPENDDSLTIPIRF